VVGNLASEVRANLHEVPRSVKPYVLRLDAATSKRWTVRLRPSSSLQIRPCWPQPLAWTWTRASRAMCKRRGPRQTLRMVGRRHQRDGMARRNDGPNANDPEGGIPAGPLEVTWEVRNCFSLFLADDLFGV